MIAVAGLERDSDNLWSGSITGHATVLTAPATGLVGARPPSGYWRVQGTSFAAPLVAGDRRAGPRPLARDVRRRRGQPVARAPRSDIGPTGRDDRFGYGLVDPVAALTADVPLGLPQPVGRQRLPRAWSGSARPPAPPTMPGSGGTGSDPLGFTAPRQQTRWTAQPAGGADDAAPRRLWTGVAVTVALVTGAALMVRRFRLWRSLSRADDRRTGRVEQVA